MFFRERMIKTEEGLRHNYRSRVLRFRTRTGLPAEGSSKPLTGLEVLSELRDMLAVRKGKDLLQGPMPIPGATTDSVYEPTLFPTVLTPIDVDRSGPEFALDSKERNRWLKEVIESRLLSDDISTDEQMALGFLHEKILEPETISAAERTFWTDFISWMVGKPRRREDELVTPWLGINSRVSAHDRNLSTFTPSIARFLRVFIDTRSRFLTQIEELKIRGPTNLVEAYLYYKYIIRGACDGFLDDIALMDLHMDSGFEAEQEQPVRDADSVVPETPPEQWPRSRTPDPEVPEWQNVKPEPMETVTPPATVTASTPEEAVALTRHKPTQGYTVIDTPPNSPRQPPGAGGAMSTAGREDTETIRELKAELANARDVIRQLQQQSPQNTAAAADAATELTRINEELNARVRELENQLTGLKTGAVGLRGTNEELTEKMKVLEKDKRQLQGTIEGLQRQRRSDDDSDPNAGAAAAAAVAADNATLRQKIQQLTQEKEQLAQQAAQTNQDMALTVSGARNQLTAMEQQLTAQQQTIEALYNQARLEIANAMSQGQQAGKNATMASLAGAVEAYQALLARNQELSTKLAALGDKMDVDRPDDGQMQALRENQDKLTSQISELQQRLAAAMQESANAKKAKEDAEASVAVARDAVSERERKLVEAEGEAERYKQAHSAQENEKLVEKRKREAAEKEKEEAEKKAKSAEQRASNAEAQLDELARELESSKDAGANLLREYSAKLRELQAQMKSDNVAWTDDMGKAANSVTRLLGILGGTGNRAEISDVLRRASEKLSALDAQIRRATGTYYTKAVKWAEFCRVLGVQAVAPKKPKEGAGIIQAADDLEEIALANPGTEDSAARAISGMKGKAGTVDQLEALRVALETERSSLKSQLQQGQTASGVELTKLTEKLQNAEQRLRELGTQLEQSKAETQRVKVAQVEAEQEAAKARAGAATRPSAVKRRRREVPGTSQGQQITSGHESDTEMVGVDDKVVDETVSLYASYATRDEPAGDRYVAGNAQGASEGVFVDRGTLSEMLTWLASKTPKTPLKTLGKLAYATKGLKRMSHDMVHLDQTSRELLKILQGGKADISVRVVRDVMRSLRDAIIEKTKEPRQRQHWEVPEEMAS